VSGPLLLPSWEQLAAKVPGITEPMRRYLEQIACVLRPGSVVNTDQTLRCFAAFLAEAAPGLPGLAQITRRHVEAFKPWLAARPGQNKPKVTPATIAHRLGALRMFFIRIDEWGWDDAPARVPMFPGDLPRLDRPLPKALDDAAAAKLLRAARQDRRMLVRVTVEMLLRTGLRVSEYTSLPASAVVLIGAGLPHIHPHQLRHTLATQAINRGMSLEAIAALLGHRSLDMTLRYAKIASRTVADEYFAVTQKVEALYGQPAQLPADAAGPRMARLRREHHRLLGNGYCTRPPQLDCAFESICETCTYFQTSIEFRPALQAQHQDAIAKHQDHREQLFASLLARIGQDAS